MDEFEPKIGDWIALYGSLMRGLGALDELGLGARMRFAGPCILAGELFDLGAFPGMRYGNGRVVAELYALLDVGAIRELDRFEDFEASRPRDSLYLRERVELLEPAGTEAWVYVYNEVPDASARLVAGDWRAHLSTRGGG